MDQAQTIELNEYLSDEPTGRLAEWIWGLSRWGKPMLVAAANIGARHAWQVLESSRIGDELMYFSPSLLYVAMAAAEAWLANPTAANFDAVREAAAVARSKVKDIEFMVEEMSGTAEEVAAREQVLAVAQACTFAALSASWQVEDVIEGVEGDVGEVSMRRGAGPAYEAVQAVRYARQALNRPEGEMRRLVAAELAERERLGPPN